MTSKKNFSSGFFTITWPNDLYINFRDIMQKHKEHIVQSMIKKGEKK